MVPTLLHDKVMDALNDHDVQWGHGYGWPKSNGFYVPLRFPSDLRLRSDADDGA